LSADLKAFMRWIGLLEVAAQPRAPINWGGVCGLRIVNRHFDAMLWASLLMTAYLPLPETVGVFL
jgi:hypothetical protein